MQRSKHSENYRRTINMGCVFTCTQDPLHNSILSTLGTLERKMRQWEGERERLHYRRIGDNRCRGQWECESSCKGGFTFSERVVPTLLLSKGSATPLWGCCYRQRGLTPRLQPQPRLQGPFYL
ncbi:hypothetical protein J6590_062938 [Homalodisca vitripennis]|nr:hypothetical protein J6590_062938 [Homalodisca vitripennis]